MGTLEDWGEFIAGTGVQSLPGTARRRLRLQTLSVLAATFQAENDEGARRVTQWARRSKGPHPLLPTGEGVGRTEAIVASAARSCTFDYDDYCLVGHTGHSAVIVPLVLGAAADLAWSDLENAQSIATELGGRLGLATFLGPQNGQNLPFVHALGAAAATARVLSLDAKRAAHALALAIAQPEAPLWPAFLGAHDGKILTTASSTLSGTIAAELAFEGVTGALDLLDHEKGFFRRMAFVPARGALEGLGDTWIAETIHVKEHPACAYFQTAIDAAVEVGAQARVVLGRPLVATDVKSIDIETTFLGAAVDAHSKLAHESMHDGIHANEVNFSLALTTAITLLSGPLRPPMLTHASLAKQTDDLRALASRTTVRHAWDLTSRMLWRLAEHMSPAQLFKGTDMADLLLAPVLAKRAFPALDVEGLSTTHLAAEASRAMVAMRDRPKIPTKNPLHALSFPFGTRLRIELTKGGGLGADRAVPRGAPSRPFAEAEDITKNKLVDAAESRLGKRKATKLVETILDPPKKLRVRDVVEMLRKT